MRAGHQFAAELAAGAENENAYRAQTFAPPAVCAGTVSNVVPYRSISQSRCQVDETGGNMPGPARRALNHDRSCGVTWRS
jgi:hypothetical protein